MDEFFKLVMGQNEFIPPKLADNIKQMRDSIKQDFRQPNATHKHEECYASYQEGDCLKNLCYKLTIAKINKDSYKPLIALYSSPGIGKSAFFDYFSDCMYKWHENLMMKPNWVDDNDLWLKDMLVITVTYSYTSVKSEYVCVYSDITTVSLEY